MNVLKITVENPEELLNASMYGAGALFRVESSATQAGTYAEVGTAALVSGTYIYTFYDNAATSGKWYRVRYSDSGGTKFSDYGQTFQSLDTGASRSYADLYAVKRVLGIAATDTTDDDWLLGRANMANRLIESRTGRIFAPDPVTVYTFDGDDALENGKFLAVPRGIRTCTLLEVAAYTSGPYMTIPSTDYFLRPSGADLEPGWPYTELWMTDIPSSGNPFPYFAVGKDTIRVTGTFGWAETPPEIAEIAETLVVGMYRARASGGTDAVTVGSAGERTIWRLLGTEQWKTLRRYTRKDIDIV